MNKVRNNLKARIALIKLVAGLINLPTLILSKGLEMTRGNIFWLLPQG